MSDTIPQGEIKPMTPDALTINDLKFMEIKSVIKDSIVNLQDITREGFSDLKGELTLSREQGHIPVSVMEKLLNSNNNAYMQMLTAINTANTESRNSANLTNKALINRMMTMMCVLLAWVTGMKIFLPETSASELIRAAKDAVTPQVEVVIPKQQNQSYGLNPK